MSLDRNPNYAIAIVKILACLAVVSLHAGGGVPFAGYAVPIFMVLSFVFWRVSSCVDLLKRLKRLYAPFLFWGVVPWLIRGVNGFDFDFKSLALQLVFGSLENPPLYFMALLAVFAIVVYGVQRVGRWGIVLLIGLCVLCVVASQSRMNESLWGSMPECGRITCGRGVELFPCCAIGILLGNAKAKMAKLLSLGGVLLLCICLFMGWNVEGFDYASPLLLSGATAVCAFTLVLNDWLPPEWMRKTVIEMAKLTGGIYYMHYVLLLVLSRFKFHGAVPGIVVTLVVFAVSAVTCFVGQRMPRLKGVFR